MEQDTPSDPQTIARHLRALRDARGLTLAELAKRSAISRATLSRIENAETSPTVETLGRLAAVYALPISQLLVPLHPMFQAVVRRDEQSTWTDPKRAFSRRSVSPPSPALSLELVKCELGPDQTITYAAPAVPGHEHHLYVLSGSLTVTVEDRTHTLTQGDCLRYVLFGSTTFQTTQSPCKYVIALK